MASIYDWIYKISSAIAEWARLKYREQKIKKNKKCFYL